MKRLLSFPYVVAVFIIICSLVMILISCSLSPGRQEKLERMKKIEFFYPFKNYGTVINVIRLSESSYVLTIDVGEPDSFLNVFCWRNFALGTKLKIKGVSYHSSLYSSDTLFILEDQKN